VHLPSDHGEQANWLRLLYLNFLQVLSLAG
jgi:hypothetical protein